MKLNITLILIILLGILSSSNPVYSNAISNQIYLPIISTPSFNQKTGYAWGPLSQEQNTLLKMSWYHHWDVAPNTTDGKGVEFIHHFSCEVRNYWSFDDDGVNQFTELRKLIEIKGDEPFYLLFLNEPDLRGQCHRTPWHSAHMYKKVLEIAPNAIIIAPQVSHSDYYNNWEWLREWYWEIDQLGLPHPAIGGIHSYMSEPAHLIIDSYTETFDTDKVWITEFASSNPDILQEMLTFYINDSRVERYSVWDPLGIYGEWSTLIDSNGDLTELGEVWVNSH